MKYLIVLISLITGNQAYSQNNENANVEQTIKEFFDGFHAQDSAIILKTVHKDIIMHSIDSRGADCPVLQTTDFNLFLKSILSIPKDVSFREKILDYKIQIDGNMAHAWTPYEFYYNGQLSHRGVNSFQLYKDNGNWKIIYVVDTRSPSNSLIGGE